MVFDITQYYLASFVVLDFDCDVTTEGPLEPRCRQYWSQAMCELWNRKNVNWKACWAEVMGNPHQLVLVITHENCPGGLYIPYRHYGPDANIQALADIVSPLHNAACVRSRPRFLHAVVEKRNVFNDFVNPAHPSPEYTVPRYATVDLFVIHSVAVADDDDDAATFQTPGGKLRQTAEDPLYCLPFTCYRPPWIIGSLPSWDDGDLLLNKTCHTLESYLRRPQPGDIIEQVVIVGYSSLAARTRFQDPAQPCNGVRNPPVVGPDTWSTEFIRPLEEMRQSGKILGLESWTLQMHAWQPDDWRPKQRTRRHHRCVVA